MPQSSAPEDPLPVLKILPVSAPRLGSTANRRDDVLLFPGLRMTQQSPCTQPAVRHVDGTARRTWPFTASQTPFKTRLSDLLLVALLTLPLPRVSLP